MLGTLLCHGSASWRLWNTCWQQLFDITHFCREDSYTMKSMHSLQHKCAFIDQQITPPSVQGCRQGGVQPPPPPPQIISSCYYVYKGDLGLNPPPPNILSSCYYVYKGDLGLNPPSPQILSSCYYVYKGDLELSPPSPQILSSRYYVYKGDLGLEPPLPPDFKLMLLAMCTSSYRKRMFKI